jgi:serine/threonine protein kinase
VQSKAVRVMRNLDGQTIGSYLVIEQTAVGGMAIIYKAYDAALDRYVALKILPEYLSHDPEFSARFRAEARNIARLRHPNILPIYGYGEENGLSYFVMDLVEGGTLKGLMGAPMEAGQAVSLVSQIADALQYAHTQNVVHRDVKPANVLMARPDWVQLSDFGIARVLEGNTGLTSTGSAFFGTPHYMAPEQARGEAVSPQTDQYALGIVLYEMLTGTTPYTADTPQAVVYQHIYSALPLPHTRNPAISDSMERVILKALAKDAPDRYADMHAFAAAAREAVDGIPLMVAPGDRPATEVAEEDSSFPPAHATNAFSPIPVAPPDTGTEMFAATPVAGVATVSSVVSPPPDDTPATSQTKRVSTAWLAAAGGALVVVVGAALLALRVFGGDGGPTHLTLVAPPGVSLGNFSVQRSDGSDAKDIGNAGRSAHFTVPSGTYTLNFSSGTTIAMPVPVSLDAGSHTVDLGTLGAVVSLKAPGHSVPTVTVVDAKGTQIASPGGGDMSHGVFLLNGEYQLQFAYNSGYTGAVRATVTAGPRSTIDLTRRMTYLRILPPKGGTLETVEFHAPRGDGNTSLNADSTGYTKLQAIAAGAYRLELGPPYMSLLPIRGKPGQVQTIVLAKHFAHLLVRQPSGRGQLDFILADPKTAHDRADVTGTQGTDGIYMRPGTYDVSFGDSTTIPGLIPVHLVAGKTTRVAVDTALGRLTVHPFPGATLPLFSITSPDSKINYVYNAPPERGHSGLYLAPGKYLLSFSDDGYLVPLRFSIVAGASRSVDLGAALSALHVESLPGLPLTGFYIDNARGQSGYYVSNTQARKTLYLPPATYRLDLSSTSERFIGKPAIILHAGKATTFLAAAQFATVQLPAVSANGGVTYEWKDDLESHQVTTTGKPQIGYVVAGRYAVSVAYNGSSRTVTLKFKAGHTVTLPRR